MEQLNKDHKYAQNMVKVGINDDGSDWPLAYNTGNSAEDLNDYSIVANHLHASDIPDELTDAKDTAELIVKLLNLYFRGMLFVGDPAQLNLFD